MDSFAKRYGKWLASFCNTTSIYYNLHTNFTNSVPPNVCMRWSFLNAVKTVIAQRNHSNTCTILYGGSSPTNIRFVNKTLSIDRGNILLSVGGVY